MNVNGVNVDDGLVAIAVSEVFAKGKSFTAREMEQRIKDNGVDAKSAYRCADRTLQKLRKDGRIFLSGRRWHVS